MGPVEFAMWRFRNAEGVMDFVKSWNMTECILDIDGKSIKITYDPEKEIATIEEPGRIFGSPIQVPFKEFVKTMTKLGYYTERLDNRHSLSYKNQETADHK